MPDDTACALALTPGRESISSSPHSDITLRAARMDILPFMSMLLANREAVPGRPHISTATASDATLENRIAPPKNTI